MKINYLMLAGLAAGLTASSPGHAGGRTALFEWFLVETGATDAIGVTARAPRAAERMPDFAIEKAAADYAAKADPFRGYDLTKHPFTTYDLPALQSIGEAAWVPAGLKGTGKLKTGNSALTDIAAGDATTGVERAREVTTEATKAKPFFRKEKTAPVLSNEAVGSDDAAGTVAPSAKAPEGNDKLVKINLLSGKVEIGSIETLKKLMGQKSSTGSSSVVDIRGGEINVYFWGGVGTAVVHCHTLECVSEYLKKAAVKAAELDEVLHPKKQEKASTNLPEKVELQD